MLSVVLKFVFLGSFTGPYILAECLDFRTEVICTIWIFWTVEDTWQLFVPYDRHSRFGGVVCVGMKESDEGPTRVKRGNLCTVGNVTCQGF